MLTSKIYEFDIYIQNTDGVNIFELAVFQAGIIINSSVINGGTITPAIISGSSQLVSVQKPTSVGFSSNCIKLAPKAGPGMGAGTIIPASSPGIRVARIRLTNSVDFGQFNPNLSFNFTSSPYNTIVSAYDQTTTLNVNITNSVFHTEAFMTNPVLNGPLSIYNVTGGGASPSVVGLSGSQAGGVNYLLYKNGNPQGSAVNGTGSLFSFGNQTNGTYTVKAHRKATYMYSDMNGSATIFLVTPPIVYAVSGGGSYCKGSGGLPVGISNSETNVTYTLYKEGVTTGQTVSGTGSAISFGNKSAGTYTVKGTNAGGTTDMSGTAVITENELPSITGTLSVCAGSTVQLTGSGTPAVNNPWVSAAPSVATVTITGLVTGVTAGTSVIIYTNNNGCSTSATVTVNSLPTITGTLSLCQGSSVQLTGSGNPASTNPWQSGSTGTATVSNTGVVSGVSAGNSNITYTNINGCQKTEIVTVNALPSISGNLTLLEVSTTQLTGSGTPATSNPWVSATTSVATISNTGLVTGVTAGTSVITYTSSTGCSTTTTVTVNSVPTLSADINESIFALKSYPNPFRDRLSIEYSLIENSDVRIVIYDIYGKLIITLVNEKQQAGNYSVHWDADSCPQGEYIIKIQAGVYQKASKVILLR